ncbi:MAG: hypothetical protein AMK72_02810 [Planctomycetes bacterium SM23_25]|nr:MAG: hypothetical protein AMK72_02810 [Planctomycetes bacterium SM23_25]
MTAPEATTKTWGPPPAASREIGIEVREATAAHLAEATPDGFKIVESVKIDRGSKQHWADPAISGQRLYVRHGEALMAFDIAAD